MQLTAATILNATGGVATVLLQAAEFVQPGVRAGSAVPVASGATSAALTGRLLTIIVERPAVAGERGVHLSFNLDGQFAPVTAIAGSPYQLTLAQGGNALRQTWTLVIAHAGGEIGRIAGTIV